MAGSPQINVVVLAEHAQEEPDLFLAFVGTAPLTPNPLFRDVVTQPVTGAAHDPDMLRQQSHFFLKLAVHGLFRGFALLDAPLWKLPRVFAYPFAPENLIAVADQNNADVRAIAFAVEHDDAFECLTAVDCSTNTDTRKAAGLR